MIQLGRGAYTLLFGRGGRLKDYKFEVVVANGLQAEKPHAMLLGTNRSLAPKCM